MGERVQRRWEDHVKELLEVEGDKSNFDRNQSKGIVKI